MKFGKFVDGGVISDLILHETKAMISEADRRPKLVIILATDDTSALIYTELKKQVAGKIGIECEVMRLSKHTTLEEICAVIDAYNHDHEVSGIVIQLPIYEHLSIHKSTILSKINIEKDVDRLSSNSLARLFDEGDHKFMPAAAQAVYECLRYYELNLVKGKQITIINNSNLIGLPLGIFFSKLKATVSILSESSVDVAYYTIKSDILISATGKGDLIEADMVKPGSIVFDLSYGKKSDGKLIKDVVVSDELLNKVRLIASSPGGIGPVTVACLMRSTAKAYFNF